LRIMRQSIPSRPGLDWTLRILLRSGVLELCTLSLAMNPHYRDRMPVLASFHPPHEHSFSKVVLADLTSSSLYTCSLSVLLYLYFSVFIASLMYDRFINLSISRQKVFQCFCLISLSLFFALIAALFYSKNIFSVLQYFY
jgi:hypothetical protein